MEQVIAARMKQVRLGPPAGFHNLSVFPVVGDGPSEPSYFTLDEAMQQHLVELGEVSEGGSVPNIRIVNKASRPILLIDGEELIGAKQNRIVNLTILVPAQQALVIPVSCVEAGRWQSAAGGFVPSSRTHYAKARAEKVRQVNVSMRADGARTADQTEIWADISAKASRMGGHSATSAMADLFEQHAAPIEAYVDAILPIDRQVGAVFAIDGEVRGLELFDTEPTLRRLLPKLVRSYAIDAIETVRAKTKAVRVQQVEAFIEAVAAATPERFPAIGLGTDVRFEGPSLTGGALVTEDAVIHLAAFHLEEPKSRIFRRSRSRRPDTDDRVF